MSITSLQNAAANRPVLAGLVEKGQARNVADLTKALRTDDLEGAKSAYKAIVDTAPEGTSWPQDSAFSKLGAALATGHLGAAKAIAADAVRDVRAANAGGTGSGPVNGHVPEPKPIMVGPGGVGTTINLVA